MKRAQMTNARAALRTFRGADAASLTRSRAPRLHGRGVKRRIFRSFYESGAKRAKPPKRAGLFLKSRRAHKTAAAAQNQLEPKKSFFPGCTPHSALDK